MVYDDGLKIIGKYLEGSIEGCQVSREADTPDHCRLSIVTQTNSYELKVAKDFLDEQAEATLALDLEAFNLARVLVELEGFAVLLSKSGCVFDP